MSQPSSTAPCAPPFIGLQFNRENVKHVWPEILPLLKLHWAEVAHYPDIPLDPDYGFYLRADELGLLRVFTARWDAELVGYCVYMVKSNPHYRSHVYACQDVLFVHPKHRGKFGLRFIGWCDARLTEEGVAVVTQHVKAAHDFGPALKKKLGYELVDHVYMRRLGK